MTPRRRENVVARKIHGSFFIIDITDNFSGDKCVLYEINEIGNWIWEHIHGSETTEDLTAELKNALVEEVDASVLYADIVEFIDELKACRFVEE